jgi:hypothetical protein
VCFLDAGSFAECEWRKTRGMIEKEKEEKEADAAKGKKGTKERGKR